MSVELQRRLFTVDDYHAMARAGVFHEDDRVELIEGQIVEMTPIGTRHSGCVNRLNRLFSGMLEDRAIVSVQNPIRLSELSEPEPDVAILRPREDFYSERHPGPDDVFLLVEVAESSVEYDRELKLPLYARSGVPEVWLVDLADDALEVHRAPSAEGYREVFRPGPDDALRPVELPELEVRAREILPAG